jgi:uncharacterized membrane protein
MLPLAHHDAIEALPVFAPVLIICLVLAVQYLRARRHWDEEEEELEEASGAGATMAPCGK